MNSGGDGGLSTILELRNFKKVDIDLYDISDATILAKIYEDNRKKQRSVIKFNKPLPPEIETAITKTKDEKYIVWYRDRM